MACRAAWPIDMMGIVSRTQTTPECRLTHNKKRVKRLIKRVLTISLIVLSSPIVSAAPTNNQVNAYRVYAHIRIIDFEQYLCFDKLIVRESQYNDSAINGIHYGLAQGTYKRLLSMSAYAQIDWAITYIARRYGSMCNALNHSLKKGWY